MGEGTSGERAQRPARRHDRSVPVRSGQLKVHTTDQTRLRKPDTRRAELGVENDSTPTVRCELLGSKLGMEEGIKVLEGDVYDWSSTSEAAAMIFPMLAQPPSSTGRQSVSIA